MSSLSLEKNGRVSPSKWTKHIKANYFLIKDYYDSGEIDLPYCPTDVMWAEVLTKPLQGQKFRDMRGLLQNCSRDSNDGIELQTDELSQRLMNQHVKTVASPEECVGELANLAREKVRKKGKAPRILRICESLEMPGKGQVSGKILRMDTQELVSDHGADRLSVLWAP
jgi:hypothetical protein